MRLGVLGGLGPMATAYYLELVISMTDAKRDQDHPEIIVLNIPSIPDRTAYILGRSSENPVVPMVKLGQQMKDMGATVIATPCITAHYFHEALQAGIGLPLIHAIRATVDVPSSGIVAVISRTFLSSIILTVCSASPRKLSLKGTPTLLL